MALASGLLDKLGQPGQYTLFAPTNDAFAKLDSDVLQRLMGDKGVLQGKPNRWARLQSSITSMECLLEIQRAAHRRVL